MKRVAIVVGQILLLALIGVLGGYLKEWLNLPLPGTLVGMILLFLLLCSGIIKLNWVEQGAAVLIGELLLFLFHQLLELFNIHNFSVVQGLCF